MKCKEKKGEGGGRILVSLFPLPFSKDTVLDTCEELVLFIADAYILDRSFSSEEDTEKAELPNAAFASVFTVNAGPQKSQAPDVREEACKKDDFPLVKEDCVRDHLSNLDTHKSMGLNGMHPGVLRELADVIAEPLSISFERSWRTGEVPEDWRKASVTPVFKKGKKEDPGNYRLVSLTSIPGKVMEQLILEAIIKQVEEKKVIRSSQHGFIKGKSCLTNLMA